MNLSTARQRITEAANIISNTRIDASPDDASQYWTPEQRKVVNAELKAIESQIDALRQKLFALQA